MMTTRRNTWLVGGWLPWAAAALFACSSLPDQDIGSGGTGGSAAGSAGSPAASGGTAGTTDASGGTAGSESASGGTAAGGTGGTSVIPIGDAGASAGGVPNDECHPRLVATIRDFDASHVDFQEDMYNSPTGFGIKGIVEDRLEDGIPVLLNPAPNGRAVTSAESFATWFSTDHPEDATYLFDLDSGYLDKTENDGVVTYASPEFFPIDDEPSAEPGFEDADGNEHNFHFTLELNTEFTYKPGDRFDFTGDDDIWVFIEDELVVDIGGVHFPDSGSIELDTLDLTAGEKYHLSLFYAERHTAQSNFRMTTTIEFTNCDPIIR